MRVGFIFSHRNHHVFNTNWILTYQRIKCYINVTLNALIRKYPIGVKYMMISMAKNKANTHIWRTDSFDLFIFPPTFVSLKEYDVTNQMDVFIHRLWS